jgi:hypothetical protein
VHQLAQLAGIFSPTGGSSEGNRLFLEIFPARYRPDRITTLFVGESAPASGACFYHGDNAMLRYMQRAREAALGVGSREFLDRFNASGWFLDDLVLTPVNALPKAQRMTKCPAAQASLTEHFSCHRHAACRFQRWGREHTLCNPVEPADRSGVDAERALAAYQAITRITGRDSGAEVEAIIAREAA